MLLIRDLTNVYWPLNILYTVQYNEHTVYCLNIFPSVFLTIGLTIFRKMSNVKIAWCMIIWTCNISKERTDTVFFFKVLFSRHALFLFFKSTLECGWVLLKKKKRLQMIQIQNHYQIIDGSGLSIPQSLHGPIPHPGSLNIQ